MFDNREGKTVPQVTFHTRRDHDWVDVTTDEIFKGKTVVVFSLPGAFTPTCSSTHVPRYNQLATALKRHGVDEIVCISVNDAFVMNEWQKEQKAHNITFLPDGNGDFSRGMGMLVAKEDLGFGERSWRYSMLVRDGVIEKMFIDIGATSRHEAADMGVRIGDPLTIHYPFTELHDGYVTSVSRS